MFDRNSVLAGAASVILGTVIGGAGVFSLTDTSSRAETASLTQSEKDSMAVAMEEIHERSMAQNQVAPQVSHGERAFMDFTMPDLSKPQDDTSENEPTPDFFSEPPVSQSEQSFMDFTMPDLSEAPQAQNLTRHGCVKPEEPAWAANVPPEDAQQALLLKALYDNLRYENIVQTNSCPCEIEYPSWDDADASYQHLLESRGLDEIQTMRSEVSRLVRRNLKASIDICRTWRGR
jgi:hypothetical protein